MIISNEMAFNIVQDWKKKNISVEEKSEFLKVLLKEKNMSQRSLARELNISHSTLQDWISKRQSTLEKKDKRKNNDLFILADRLQFLLTKEKFVREEKLIFTLHRLRREITRVIGGEEYEIV